MKITICTTPIRPVPTDYPPFGSLAVIQSLRSAGYDPYFFDIDGLRPSFDRVVEFFRKQQPEVVGISAVVSTAYEYTKRLSKVLKQIIPNVRIVVGGNLAASAEILHRLCGVDFCAIGEGEKVSVNLIEYLESHKRALDYSALKNIKGITYLHDGEMVFTGYESPIPAEELFQPDFDILEKYSRVENFITDPFTRDDFAQDPRSYEPHRAGKKMATVVSAKGCVARCTFCHRWDKGFRQIPAETVIAKIKYLMDRYNVGFIQFGDENFGSDRKETDKLIELLKPLDILYEVAGVRCRSVDPDLLKRLKASGCVALYYGMETGSPNMLQVMEKKTELEQNLRAARWSYEAGLYTIYQLVVAMPGESPETIAETTAFLESVTEFLPDSPTKRLSVNYIQALPGTPVYEYARTNNLIGKSLEDEESYLLEISDVNANDDSKFLNFTKQDYLTVRSWRQQIKIECLAHYLRHNNLYNGRLSDIVRNLSWLIPLNRFDPERYIQLKATKSGTKSDYYTQGSYFNISRQRYNYVVAGAFYPIRHVFIWAWLLITHFKQFPVKVFVKDLWETISRRMRRQSGEIPYKSLRKVVAEIAPAPQSPSEAAMVPLRAGR
jgi:radical SAM superfamily enzyme YgiQ (UPF0313 family)